MPTLIGPEIVNAIIGMLASNPFKPYLLRAFHEFASQNSDTPHIIVDASVPGVDVPAGWVKDNRITLNISWSATGQLFIGDTEVTFRANFGQNQIQCKVPIESILVAYGRESGFQIPFIRLQENKESVATAKAPEKEPERGHIPVGETPIFDKKKKDRSHLTVVK